MHLCSRCIMSLTCITMQTLKIRFRSGDLAGFLQVQHQFLAKHFSLPYFCVLDCNFSFLFTNAQSIKIFCRITYTILTNQGLLIFWYSSASSARTTPVECEIPTKICNERPLGKFMILYSNTSVFCCLSSRLFH